MPTSEATRPVTRRAEASAFRYLYNVYGVSLRSEIPLSLEKSKLCGESPINIETAPATFFARAIRGAHFEQDLPEWYRYAPLDDRSSYVRWKGLGEFLVSKDGCTVKCRKFRGTLSESFQVYLLQRALSFALVKKGLEPLHATAVIVDGQAIAFLGNSGFGKSSLAACFLANGHKLLTDDLLILRRCAAGLRAYPGPPRIKLFPNMARRFLKDQAAGVAMNPLTKKLVLPLNPDQLSPGPALLKAIYVLESPRESQRTQPVRFIPLDPRQAFSELLKNTYNYQHVASDRLQRQFVEASSLACALPIKKLCHSRAVQSLPALRDAILADARRTHEETVCSA